MRIKGKVLPAAILLIFMITQVTWSFNNCPTCFSRSLPNFTSSVSKSNQSCCGSKQESRPSSCSSCSGECRCSSLETLDNVDGVLSLLYSLENLNSEIQVIFPVIAAFTALFPDSFSECMIGTSPPPQLPVSCYLFYKTDILRN